MKKLLLLSILGLTLMGCDTDKKAVNEAKEKAEQPTKVDNASGQDR